MKKRTICLILVALLLVVAVTLFLLFGNKKTSTPNDLETNEKTGDVNVEQKKEPETVELNCYAGYSLTTEDGIWTNMNIAGLKVYKDSRYGDDTSAWLIQDGIVGEDAELDAVPEVLTKNIRYAMSWIQSTMSCVRNPVSSQKVTIAGKEMIRDQGEIILDRFKDGTEVYKFDYVAYYFLTESSHDDFVSPAYAMTVVKTEDAEDENYKCDEVLKKKKLSRLDEMIKTYKER